MTSDAARIMTEGGKSAGSNPALWYGLFDEVPVGECLIEREVSPRVWEESTLDEIVAWSDAMDEAPPTFWINPKNECGLDESISIGDSLGMKSHGSASFPPISFLTP